MRGPSPRPHQTHRQHWSIQMNKIKAYFLAAAAAVLSFFDKGVEGVLKDFTKLDQKLDRTVSNIRTRREASFKRSEAALSVMNQEFGRRTDLRLEEDRAMRVRSEEHTSELQSLMRISYAVFCL